MELDKLIEAVERGDDPWMLPEVSAAIPLASPGVALGVLVDWSYSPTRALATLKALREKET